VDELVWVLARNLEYAHKQILEWKRINKRKESENEEEENEEEVSDREDEVIDKPLTDKRKSKKSIGQKEMKALLG
jgi:hypothetical protein